MSESTPDLGGRVPLFEPRKLTAAQQALFDRIHSNIIPWAESSGFRAKLEDGKLLGPFNTMLHSPEIADSFLALQGTERQNTTLTARVREVVILTVGAVWKCDYERYAHTAVARKAGLSDRAIEALVKGIQAGDLNEAENLAQRVTWHLTAEHQLPEPLYTEAVSAFGVRGLVDLIFLAGCYETVASLLTAFQVPAPG